MTRLLVAGAGLIGRRHIAHIRDHPALTLVGVIDPDPAARADLPCRGVASFAEVDVAADGIVLATPSDLHAEHAEEAAARGWHMLIEKPVATTLAETDRIIAAARTAGLHTLVGHHRRHHPKVRALKTILTSGRIGAPVGANLIWAMKKPDSYFDVPWRSGNHGSPVMINLVHEVDLVRFLFGEITGVTGIGGLRRRARGRVEAGAVALGFDTGAVATILFADTTPSPWAFEAGTGENPNIAATGQDCMRIIGTEGAVSFPSLTVWSGAADWSQAPKPDTGQDPLRSTETVPLIAQLDHFADVIAGRARPLTDAADARRTLAATLAIEDAVNQTSQSHMEESA